MSDQATVSFSPPVNDGGAPIYQFTVTAMPGGITATGTGSPITVTGLTDGVQYTFIVTATNSYGTGPASAPSNPVTPSTTPSAPTDVQAFNLNGVIQLFFEAPFNGGAPIIDYTAASTPASTPVSSGTSPITISGLTLGTSYTFVVTATNANGIGPASVASNPVTPSTGAATAPSPPTGLVATAGVNSAVVTFTPGANGGSPITDFAAKASPGGVTVYGAASPLTVTGLAAETSYTFTVTATNAVGTSSPSAPSNAVTPTGVAGAPTAVTASAGAAQASVAFTAPAYNGGSAVFNYLVSSSLGGAPTAGATSPILVTGLINGQPYTFTVKAQNAAGIGPASSPSNSVIPSTVPSAPAGVTAAAGNAQAVVSFTAPATGGSPITAYTATASPGGATASGASSPLIVAGLANGTSYTFTVTATNADGTGLPSAPSTPVTPSAVVPSAPQLPAATAGNTQATVTFSPPTSTGGAPITGYVATASPGGASAAGSASPLIVSGLINGLAYTFTVAAVNSAGTGAASVATNAVTPSGLPFAPTGLVATPGNAQASVAFTAANGNGAAVSGYTVTASPGGITGTAATSPVLVTGLTNGTAYTFTATATNANGTSAPSAPSRAVTPATVPSAPTSPVATAGNANASVAFSAPASTGGSAITSYIVTSSAGQSASGAASPVTVPNLTNGTAYTFTVIAVNSIGAGPSSVASNSVTPYAPTPFQITTASLPSATVGVPYSASVVAANGVTPYTYVNTTAMPAGLSISSSGAISGTPSAAATTSVGFQATDSAGNKTAVTSLAITVSAMGMFDDIIARATRGPYLVNGVNAVMQGRGADFSGLEDSAAQGQPDWYGTPPNWPYYQTWKPNIVRIPLNAASWLGLSCYTVNSAGNGWVSTTPRNADFSGTYRASVIAAARSAQAIGCYVIFDEHWSAPKFTFNGLTGYAMPLWQPAFCNGDTSLAFHQSLASVFGTQATPQPGINNFGIIIDVFNEPYLDQINGNSNNAATWNLMKNGGTQTSFSTNNATTAIAQTWTVQGYQSILNAYRSVGANNLLMFGGCGYAHAVSGFATFLPTDTLAAPQIAVSIHLYQQGTTGFPLTYPDAGSGTASWSVPLQAVLAAGIPVICGESGGTCGPSAPNPDTYVQYVTNQADSLGFSYIGWEFWAPVSPTYNGTNNLSTTTPSPTNGQGTTLNNWMVNHPGATTVPSAPLALTATPSNAAATVSFSAPASTGGTPITGYTVTSSPGALTGVGTASPLVVTGLTNGQAYTFTVTATNAIGTGAASAPSNSVTPTAASALAVLTNGVLNTSALPYDYSYSGTFNYGNTTNLQSGTSGNLEVTGASQYGSGWQPASNWPAQFSGGNNGIDLSAYTSIQFSVYAAHPATISLFKHYTRSTGNDIATSCGIDNITNVQSVPANTWTSITVNLALIGGLASFNDYKTALQDSTQENWFINSAQYLPGNYAWIYNGDPNATLQSAWTDASTATVNYAKSPNSINSSLYAVNNPPTKATVFTGAISGTTLTVSGLTGSIEVGQVVLWNGQGTPPTIVSGSGSTWVVSPTQGTVTSQQMVTGFNQSAINCVQVTSAAGQYWEVTTSGFSLSMYNNFTFAALPTQTGYLYKVQFLSTLGTLIGNSVTASTPQDNGVQTSAWNMYLVALSAFGLGSTTNIGGVRITNTSGATTDYYGAIGFVS